MKKYEVSSKASELKATPQPKHHDNKVTARNGDNTDDVPWEKIAHSKRLTQKNFAGQQKKPIKEPDRSPENDTKETEKETKEKETKEKKSDKKENNAIGIKTDIAIHTTTIAITIETRDTTTTTKEDVP